MGMSLALFCVINPVLGLNPFESGLNITEFLLLLISTTFIAIAGYLQNDLVDINPDSVNKPGKNLVGRKFRVYIIQILYWVFNIIGILAGVLFSFLLGKINYSLIFLFSAGLLWFYSERYQCQPLIGNIVVAFLSALSIAIVWLFSFFALAREPVIFTAVQGSFSQLNKLMLVFIGFAFVTSLLREVVKDIEDFKGDDRFGCRTFPVVYGINKAKWLSMLIALIALAMSIWCQVFFFKSGYQMLFYGFFLIDLLYLTIAFMLNKSKIREDYRNISGLIKLLMVIGILSMALVYIEHYG